MDERETIEEKKDLKLYMASVIEKLQADKKRAAVHTYTCTLHSFIHFSGSKDTELLVKDVFTPGTLKAYQEWMIRRGLRWNTVSTYMRTLQAVFHRLVIDRLVEYTSKLFDDVYTKVEPQTKRALTEEQMGHLLHADSCELPERLRQAQAYFLLMFLFRGMPFIDLAHLRKQDIRGNNLVYCRHKTGRQLMVRIPREAILLLEMYRNRNPDSTYLFPILDERLRNDERLYQCYLGALRRFNRELGEIAEKFLPGVKISSYTARHTWATLAFYQGVHVGIISKALGHSSIKVTETYLKPFENEKIDKANEELIISVIKNSEGKKVA